MEEFEPPMGTAQEVRVVGGVGMDVGAAQDMLVVVVVVLLLRCVWCLMEMLYVFKSVRWICGKGPYVSLMCSLPERK
jgi:hypothetical protein